MATKLRNIPYNLFLKTLYYLCMVFALGYFLYMLSVTFEQEEVVFKDNFYETSAFQENYTRLSHNVVEKELYLIDEKTIKEEEDEYTRTNNLERLRRINENLLRAPSFKYVLVNQDTHRVITNVNEPAPIEYIENLKTVIQWGETGVYFPVNSQMNSQISVYQDFFFSNGYNGVTVSGLDVIKLLNNQNWYLYTAVDFDEIHEDMTFGSDYENFIHYSNMKDDYFQGIALSFIVFVSMLVILSTVLGKKGPDAEVKEMFYDRIPLEIQTIFWMMISFVVLYMTQNVSQMSIDETYYLSGVFMVLFGLFYVVYASFVRLVKTKRLFKNMLITRMLELIRNIFAINRGGGFMKLRIVVLMAFYVLVNCITVLIAWELMNQLTFIILLGLLLFNLLIAGYVVKQWDQLHSLIKATHYRAAGQTEYEIDTSRYDGLFRRFGYDLNQLQNGLQVALDEAIKGEKLKTELITNVSHDLKNPLTSIVTYIDLLKKTMHNGNGDEDKTEEYISVLETKSQRLKHLIEDLVAASKASSGSLEVDLQTLDIKQLILQCVGEKEVDFEERGLEVVYQKMPTDPVTVRVDVNHMVRVFDNLLSNIAKYGLEQTRVYIQFDYIEATNEQVICLKNISNHPLEVDVKQLTERFVRGEVARTTEGSGLGLSIVESLMQIQDGQLSIEMDGDLFKAYVIMNGEKSGEV